MVLDTVVVLELLDAVVIVLLELEVEVELLLVELVVDASAQEAQVSYFVDDELAKMIENSP